MTGIKVGDRVRLRKATQYPCPGYVFGDAEGTVNKWLEWEELMEGFEDYVYVKLDKTAPGAEEFINKGEFFLLSEVEKI